MPVPRRQITFLLALCLTLPACVAVTVEFGDPSASGAAPPRPWPASANCPVPARTSSDAPRLLALINAERARAGLAPLSPSPALAKAAHAFACEAATRGDINHTGSDGSTLRERLARVGLAPGSSSENTAAGQTSPEQVFAGWMASPRHRANILRADSRFFGLGQADGASPVWVTDFSS